MSLHFPSRSMRVKILYTFGTTSTCLARLNSVNVPIQTYEDTSFGLLELSACLDAICMSSPEIVSEQSLDYSVYTVDITEPDAPLVGHGKLSSLRYQNDVTIVGSVVQSQVPFFGFKETLEVTIKLTPIPGTSCISNADQGFIGLEWMEQHLSRKNSITSKSGSVQGGGPKRGLMDDDELNDPFHAPWPPKKMSRIIDQSSPGSYLASSPVAFTTPGAHPDDFPTDEEHNSRNTPHPLQEVETNNAPTVEDEPMDAPTVSSTTNSAPSSNNNNNGANTASGNNDNTSNSKNVLTPPLTSSAKKPPVKSPTPEKKKAKRAASTRKTAAKARRSNTAGSSPPKQTKQAGQKQEAEQQSESNANIRQDGFPPDTLCSNCGVNKTASWRRARRKDEKTGEHEEILFCNPCGLYWAKHRSLRPRNYWGKEVLPRKRNQPNSVLTANIFTVTEEERKRMEKEAMLKRVTTAPSSTPVSTPALPSSKTDVPQSEDAMPSSPTPRPMKLPSSPIGAVCENHHNKENVPPRSLSSDPEIDSLFMAPLTPKKNILSEAAILNTSPPHTNSSPNTWLSKIIDKDSDTFKFLLDSSPTKVMSEDFMEMMSSDTVVESDSGKPFFYMYDDDTTGKPTATKKPTAANAAASAANRSQSSVQ